MAIACDELCGIGSQEACREFRHGSACRGCTQCPVQAFPFRIRQPRATAVRVARRLFRRGTPSATPDGGGSNALECWRSRQHRRHAGPVGRRRDDPAGHRRFHRRRTAQHVHRHQLLRHARRRRRRIGRPGAGRHLRHLGARQFDAVGRAARRHGRRRRARRAGHLAALLGNRYEPTQGGAVPRRHRVGLRLRAGGDRPVLLPARSARSTSTSGSSTSCSGASARPATSRRPT